jgi:hypothetical protein
MAAHTDIAGRADYDQIVDFKGVAPGEPIFMIRGQDAVAGDTVRAWVMLASAGAPPALLEQALRQADRLDAWPTKKTPDADHLTPDEQKNLVYCLRRRAWNAREDVLDLRIFLAEQRAQSEVAARLAKLAMALFDEAKEAAFEAQRALAAGDREAGQHALGRAEGLARAREVFAEFGGAA